MPPKTPNVSSKAMDVGSGMDGAEHEVVAGE
jgi:hypothetical protein